MLKVLFVCTGNTCRSPMAEFLFNKIVQENNINDWQAVSAGISAIPGYGISPYALTVLREEEIDSSAHFSKGLTLDSIRKAVLVLTMTEQQKELIKSNYPQYREKIFTLKEFTGKIRGTATGRASNVGELDIIDPYGQREETYRATRDEIKGELETILGNLNHFKIKAGNFINMENNNNINRGDMVKIAIGSDHAGYDLKMEIVKFLQEAGYEYKDMGTDSTESVDYPDYGYKVARAVTDKEYDKGILICGTGIGMSIAANKVKGIRAALCHDVFSAKATRNHNNSNVLTLGARIVGNGLALEIVKTWLGEDFAGGRHQNRIDKISKIEGGE